jgi:hypothetical protein
MKKLVVLLYFILPIYTYMMILSLKTSLLTQLKRVRLAEVMS